MLYLMLCQVLVTHTMKASIALFWHCLQQHLGPITNAATERCLRRRLLAAPKQPRMLLHLASRPAANIKLQLQLNIMSRLKKLQLGRNRLADLDMLGCMSNLTQVGGFFVEIIANFMMKVALQLIFTQLRMYATLS